MNRHYLCRFVSSLVSMGTGQEGTRGDKLGPGMVQMGAVRVVGKKFGV